MVPLSSQVQGLEREALRALERTVGAQGSRSSLITRNETILLFSLR